MSNQRIANVLRSIVAGLFLIAWPVPVVAQDAAPKGTLTKEVIGNGVYLFRASSSLDRWTATNVVVVVNDDDVTVFDSNTRPATARMVIAEIRKITPKPVRTMINSHWHLDHWSGNHEYQKAFPGVQIIATTETRDYMKRMGGEFFAHSVDGTIARQRAALDSATRTGKLADGSPLTSDARKTLEATVAASVAFAAEIRANPRVLPTLAFRDTLVFWRGNREFRLISVTGDATGSAVLYLPAEQILVMGDVLVTPEDGNGPPPWTTNSYAIRPWLTSLRGLATLDARVVVPGQGPALNDTMYLSRTADLFAAIIDQVHAALERGVHLNEDVQKAVNVDSIGRLFSPRSAAADPRFRALVSSLVRKALQESLDGIAR